MSGKSISADRDVANEEVEMQGLGAESVKIAANYPPEKISCISILKFRNNNTKKTSKM